MQVKDIHFHAQLLERWKEAFRKNRLPHTIMLTGKDGYGTLDLARQLAEMILCKDENCLKKIRSFNHPDLHFIVPSVSHPKAGSEVSSLHFMDEWKAFLEQYPFGDLRQWTSFLQADNKQAIIRVKDAENILQSAYKYPLLGENKVFIIWHAEKMNKETANKLLKLLEEPPENTYFILTTDQPLQILSTIRSRCVTFEIPPVPSAEIKEVLENRTELDPASIQQLIQAGNGDWNKISAMLDDDDPYALHKDYFVRWVRIAYKAKKDARAVNELNEWAEKMAAEPKSFQLDFLRFAMEILRRSYLKHLVPSTGFFDFSAQSFNPEKFYPFIHSNNIEGFYQALNDAHYHLMRNAQPKIVFMDLSIQMSRLLHKKFR